MNTLVRTFGLPTVATCAAAAVLSSIALAPAAASTQVTPKISEHALELDSEGLGEPGARNSSQSSATAANQSSMTNLSNALKSEEYFETAAGLTPLGVYDPTAADGTQVQNVAKDAGASDAEDDASEKDAAGAPAPDMSAGVKEKTEDGVGIAAISQPLDVPETRASVVGIKGLDDAEVFVEVRTRTDEGWDTWTALDIEDSEEGVAGTEPFVVSDATKVQLRVLGTEAPEDARLVVIDPRYSANDAQAVAANAPVVPAATLPADGSIPRTEDRPDNEYLSEDDLAAAESADGSEASPQAATGEAGSSEGAGEDTGAVEAENVTDTVVSDAQSAPEVGTAQAQTVNYVPGTAGVQTTSNRSVPKPDVGSRSAWGANESWRSGSPDYAYETEAAVIHHTAGSNNYSAEQVPGIIRGTYSYHTKALGWSDIGYNVLVDKYGRLWEGRAGGLDKNVIGAHVANYNTGSFGVSVMGTFTDQAPPEAALEAVEQIIAWKFDRNGIDPSARTNLDGRNIPTIVGHRDLGSTECPGQAFYDKLGQVRDNVGKMIDNKSLTADLTALQKAYVESGMDLGKAYGNEYSILDGFAHVFEKGIFVYRKDLGGHSVRDGILSLYQGRHREALGLPTSEEVKGLKGDGAFQKFENGAIHWSPDTSAHYTLHGPIQDYWADKGYERGHLGYPDGQPECTDDGTRCEQLFQGARLVWVEGRGITEFSPTGSISAGATDLTGGGATDLG
ncbi:N-acetylmuramoyl-L-alanine amidase [Brevibacterium litoralis]|uniref:N-acetylmuramoyl-L-alanine amidase n=1 Tax=Brevibacterium litoralis TaxID=3138935 RepID=UPI0032F07381